MSFCVFDTLVTIQITLSERLLLIFICRQYADLFLDIILLGYYVMNPYCKQTQLVQTILVQ